jgi:K+-sensing histidine kinase KdpD
VIAGATANLRPQSDLRPLKRNGHEYGVLVRAWLSRDRIALPLALLAPPAVSALLLPARGHLANTQVALVLVVVVVAVSASGNRLAGIVAAVSAGVWFDFFFTRPFQRFTITDRADVETFVLLLVVGIAVTEVAAWGRRQQALASRDAGYLAGIHAAAEVGAIGGSPSALVKNVANQLISTLGLLGCHYQAGVSGSGNPARLERDGRVIWNGSAWDVARSGLPTETAIELLVQSGGRLHGRFLLSAPPNNRVSLAQRLVAVTLADQVGAALSSES